MLMEAHVDVQALRYFVEVARRQGFTRASEALHVTQPAISKMVKALEEELGTPLLVRERRRVTLTDAGRVVLERAQGVLDSLRAIEEEVVELALRMLKASLNAADDGLAGIQQLAGDATLLFYMTDEAQEGRDAYVAKRRPDFSKFPRRP